MSDEKYSSVPFSYRARLERAYGAENYHSHTTQTHCMHLTGRLHPVEYSAQSALALFAAKVQPLQALGWRLVALNIRTYDGEDA